MPQTSQGALKVLAKKRGMSVEALQQRLETESFCFMCEQWKERGQFDIDRSRSNGVARACKVCKHGKHRATYIKKGFPRRYGPAADAPRDGDKKQARHRVNLHVDHGWIPDPNALPCTDCGHEYAGDKRHEYDHYLGYDAEHHLDVQVVCSTCHHARERAKGRRYGPHKNFVG